MKIGIRKPSIKKSIKARTTGKAKRAIKKAVIPGYGKKGTGVLKDPKKAVYNKVYKKTSFSIFDLFKYKTPPPPRLGSVLVEGWVIISEVGNSSSSATVTLNVSITSTIEKIDDSIR